MAWDRELEDFFTTTVTYTPHASQTVYGAQTFSTAALTILARIEHDTRLVRDQTGREVVSNTALFLKPTSSTGTTYGPVTIKDSITLPSGYDPTAPPLITVQRINDEEGFYFWQVRC